MLDYFADWMKDTATFEELSTTTNSAGQPIESWSAVTDGANIDVALWTDSSRETNVNDRFVDQATGTALIDPGDIPFTPDTTMRMDIDGVYYYVEGVDNVAGFNEMFVLKWRREI